MDSARLPYASAPKSPGQTLIDEQDVCFLGLNEAFGVTLPSLSMTHLPCEAPVRHPWMLECPAHSGTSVNMEDEKLALRTAGPRRPLVPPTPHEILEKPSAADVLCQDGKVVLLTLGCQYLPCFRLLWKLAAEGPFPDRWLSQRWGRLGCWGDVLPLTISAQSLQEETVERPFGQDSWRPPGKLSTWFVSVCHPLRKNERVLPSRRRSCLYLQDLDTHVRAFTRRLGNNKSPTLGTLWQ